MQGKQGRNVIMRCCFCEREGKCTVRSRIWAVRVPNFGIPLSGRMRGTPPFPDESATGHQQCPRETGYRHMKQVQIARTFSRMRR